MMHEPIAYTYEADYHCPGCAEARFGRCPEPGCWDIATTFDHEPEEDSESNPVGAVAPWDEWWEPSEPLPQSLVCGTCGEIITTLDGGT